MYSLHVCPQMAPLSQCSSTKHASKWLYLELDNKDKEERCELVCNLVLVVRKFLTTAVTDENHPIRQKVKIHDLNNDKIRNFVGLGFDNYFHCAVRNSISISEIIFPLYHPLPPQYTVRIEYITFGII